MNAWYYVDAAHDRQGPVSAEELAAAFRQGRVNRDTLVWREGLAQWEPLENHLGEMPVPPPAVPPALPAGAPDAPGPAPGPDEVVDAGFIRRLGAYLIDALLVGSVYYVVLMVGMVLVAVVAASQDFQGDGFMAGLVLVYLLYPVLSLAYYAGMESSKLQATVGKLALGIKVVDAEGRRLGFGRASARWAGSIVSYLILYIGFFMAGWTRRKQALHDLMASTFVVDKWAYTDQPGRQVRELHGCLVAAVVGVLVLGVVFVGGILAAISVPAYQDYLVRSKLMAAYVDGSAAATQVAGFRAQTDRCPRDGAELGLSAPTSTDIQEILVIENPDGSCGIAVTLRDLDGLKAAAGGVLYIDQAPDGARSCHAEGIPDRLLPPTCR